MSLYSNTPLPKLFISGFPLEITELALAKLIAPYGDIATIKIVRDKKTRVCKGYAFVEMETLEGAQAVIEALNGNAMAERLLTVKLTEEEIKKSSPTPRTLAPHYLKAGLTAGTDAADRHRRPRKRLNA